MCFVNHVIYDYELKIFADEFKKAIKYCEVPWEYFETGETYSWEINEIPVAGFALIPGYWNLRAIKHLPIRERNKFYYSKYSSSLSEFTGFFINKELKCFSKLIFGLCLFKTCLFHKNRYFIYSYRFSETHLGKYYSVGKPYKVYSGKLEPLEGYDPNVTPEEEHVEIITKFGLFRIFINRMIKTFFVNIVKRRLK